MNNNEIEINLTQEVNAILPAEVKQVFSCYSLAAKNIRNKTIFFISNIQSSYVYHKDNKNYTLKNTLHQNEINVIGKANQVIDLLNLKAINKDNKKSKLLKKFDKIIDKNTFFQSTNKSFIENLIRFSEKNIIKNINYKVNDNLTENFNDYTSVNSILAQNVVQKVCDDFNHFSKSLVSYFNNPASFLAKPKKPSYKGKSELSSFEVSSSRLNKNGSILTINDKHQLFFDFKKQQPLIDKKIISAYNHFDFNTFIQNDIKEKNLFNKYSQKLKVTLLRVVPLPYSKHQFKLQYTISFPMELKGVYAELIEQNPQFLTKKDNDKYKIIKEFINNKVDKTQNIPCFASMDLGHVNIASIYYFNGLDNIGLSKADIISSKNFIARINKLDNKIDKQKQGFYNPAIKADKPMIDLLVKVEKNKIAKEHNQQLSFGETKTPIEALTQKDYELLKEHSKKIYEDKLIRKSTYRKANITKDYLHKLSKQIVDNLVSKSISLLIIGKNKSWKQDINIGSKNNRRAYNLPHSRLIELLKYKCLLKNIMLIEQEESYTSKTSFAHNEKLREYNQKKETEGNQSPLTSAVSQVIRDGQKLYILSKVKEGKKDLLCHADLNGAMNIARKVIPEFSMDKLKSYGRKQNFAYRLVKLETYAVGKGMLAELR